MIKKVLQLLGIFNKKVTPVQDKHKKTVLTHYDSDILNQAVDLAIQASEAGDAPFGAVIEKDGAILATGYNHTSFNSDPILHAEIVAFHQAFSDNDRTQVEGGTLYCSCEPCIMCLSAAYYAGIKRIVYGATIDDAIKFGSGDPNFTASQLVILAKLDIEIERDEGGRQKAVDVFEKHIRRYGKL